MGIFLRLTAIVSVAAAMATSVSALQPPASRLTVPGTDESTSGQPHGFFNESPWLEVTTVHLDQFLTRLGYLSGELTVLLPVNAPSLTQKKGTQP